MQQCKTKDMVAEKDIPGSDQLLRWPFRKKNTQNVPNVRKYKIRLLILWHNYATILKSTSLAKHETCIKLGSNKLEMGELRSFESHLTV